MHTNPFNFEQAHHLFSYCPDKGEVRWKNPPGTKMKTGDLVGYFNDRGRLVVRFGGMGVYVHRLVWLMHFGEWPALTIDHINGDRADNRIANLRLLTVQHNNENRRKASKNNKTGFLGVIASPSGRRFYAGIQTNGKSLHLGSFATPQEAYAVYVKAKQAMHVGCTL